MSDLSRRLGLDQPGAWTALRELELRDWAVSCLDACDPKWHHDTYKFFNGNTIGVVVWGHERGGGGKTMEQARLAAAEWLAADPYYGEKCPRRPA